MYRPTFISHVGWVFLLTLPAITFSILAIPPLNLLLAQDSPQNTTVSLPSLTCPRHITSTCTGSQHMPSVLTTVSLILKHLFPPFWCIQIHPKTHPTNSHAQSTLRAFCILPAIPPISSFRGVLGHVLPVHLTNHLALFWPTKTRTQAAPLPTTECASLPPLKPNWPSENYVIMSKCISAS